MKVDHEPERIERTVVGHLVLWNEFWEGCRGKRRDLRACYILQTDTTPCCPRCTAYSFQSNLQCNSKLAVGICWPPPWGCPSGWGLHTSPKLLWQGGGWGLKSLWDNDLNSVLFWQASLSNTFTNIIFFRSLSESDPVPHSIPRQQEVLGTRGAVLHHSAETVLCFRNHVVFPSSPSSSQSLSSG